MKRVIAVVLPVLLLFAIGCTNAERTAAQLAQDVAVSVNQADIAIDQLRLQGTIAPDEERNILGYLNTLNSLDTQYVACLKVAKGASIAGGFTGCAQTLATSMGNPANLVALHVKNADAQQKVTGVAQGIATLVTVTITALGGK